MTKNDVCNRIKSIRQRLKITQENIADSMGISTGEYYKLESGKYNFTIEQIITLSDILNVHIASFFIEPGLLSYTNTKHLDIIGSDVNNKIIAAEVPLSYNNKKKKNYES